MRKATHVDNRNYDREAFNMTKDLSVEELYKLYEIVVQQQNKRNSQERDNELFAVRKAIETRKGIDYTRLKKTTHGYSSSMANDLNLGDIKANQKKNKKKS